MRRMTMSAFGRRKALVVTALATAAASAAIWWFVASPARIALVLRLWLVVSVALPAIALRGWRRLADKITDVAAFVVATDIAIRLCYGGGAQYADTGTAPALPETALEPVIALDYPPGNVAVSADG